jgi:anti-sigma regulatory factor (Ser/Thr protein kinase)
MSTAVAKFLVEAQSDVFMLRQHGRVAAAAIGLDEPDQIRLATALSEIGRESITYGGSITAVFELENKGGLIITLEDFPRAAIEKNPVFQV